MITIITFNTLQINQLITPDPTPKYHKFEVLKNGMEWVARGQIRQCVERRFRLTLSHLHPFRHISSHLEIK